jgi:hypothetical protein
MGPLVHLPTFSHLLIVKKKVFFFKIKKKPSFPRASVGRPSCQPPA